MAKNEGGRRSWSLAERQAIVEQALGPNTSVALTARRHGVNANLVFKWIRRSREGWLDRRCGPRAPRVQIDTRPSFVPIEIVAAALAAEKPLALPAPISAPSTSPPRRARQARRAPGAQPGSGMMEIVLPNGARLSCDARIDEAALRRVLAALGDV